MHATGRIVGALFELNRLMRQRMVKAEHAGDVNMHQMHALLCVQEHPSCTMSDLARFLHITQASATPLVGRLVRLGMVKRLADRRNRKCVRVRLTAAGTSELRKAVTRCHRTLHAIFSRIPPKDQETMAAILDALLTSVRSHAPSRP